jgi:hypothetical protein
MDDMNRRVAELRGWNWHRDAEYWADKNNIVHFEGAPDYLHSLDACKELIEEIVNAGCGFQLRNTIIFASNKYEFIIWDPINTSNAKEYWAEKDSNEEAICTAYIAWKEAQNG